MQEIRKQPMYRFLAALTISSAVGFQTWRTLLDNSAVRVADLDGHHIGLVQAFREIPGFLTLMVIFIIMVIREHRLSALSIITLGLGVAITGLFPSFLGLLLTTLVMSFGMHYYSMTNHSLTLQYFKKDTAPWVMGKLRSLSAASNIGIGILIYIIAPVLSFAQIYLFIGSVVIVTGVWGFFQDPTDQNRIPQRKEMVFRRKYWLFYFLTFMAGARRQIFIAFAVFLMVKKFNYTLQEITVIFVINNIVSYFINPLIGKYIIRFGERSVLTLGYSMLTFVFLGYAVAESRMLVAVLYIVDNIFYNFSIAIQTYFQKVADPADIAPSIAMGSTINHVASVILPVVGGVLWLIDYRIPFVGGAIMSLVSLLAARKIRIED